VINLDRLSFAYPPTHAGASPTSVLRDCSLRLGEGDSLAVMGASGAGKSTLCHVLAGLAPRHTGGTAEGVVTLGGHNVLASPPDVDAVGLLFQDAATQLFTTSVEDEVAWGLEALGVDPLEITRRVDAALAGFDLTGVRTRAPWALSGGQQKRLALAALWAMRPSVLVLDEPLGGLDPQGKREVLAAVEALRQAGTTLVTTTMQIATARRAGQVALLAEGRLSHPQAPAAAFDTAGPLSVARLTGIGVIAPTALWPDLKPTIAPDGARPAIEVTGLQYGYPGDEVVLRGIDLAIATGQFLAIVGPNGAGKSTLVRHFNGLLRPQSGRVRVQGELIGDRPTGALAREVGFLFQRPEQQLFAPSVREEIEFGLTRLGLPDRSERLDRAVARFDLGEVAGAPPATLSYGDQRAVTLACLAAMGPPTIILDEPTVGLDGRGLSQLLAWLAELRAVGTTIIAVTHHMDLAARADRVVALDRGRIVADGAPSEVLSHDTPPRGTP